MLGAFFAAFNNRIRPMPKSRLIVLAALALAGQIAGADAAVQNPATISNFSGAFLAARTAEADGDLESAVRFYEQALAFKPDDTDLRQNLMLTLLAAGKLDAALPHAERLKAVPEVERFSRLALAVDAFRRNDAKAAGSLLKLSLETDLDILVTRLMSAWALLGEGNGKDAVAKAEAVDGPDWYVLFREFHTALVAEAAGLDDKAKEFYRRVTGDPSLGAAAPDVYLRAVEAYSRFLARIGDKDEALAVLDRAAEFPVSRLMFARLRSEIAKGDKPAPLVADARAGAAEVLLDIGAALNREGGEGFVQIYLHLARALTPDGDAVLVQLAQAAERGEASQQAIDYYAKVPADSPLKRIAELQLALNLADLERYDEATSHLESLIAGDPDDMRAYLSLGSVHAAKEDYRSAAAVYDRAIARIAKPERGDWNMFYQRGIAFERIKEWPKAEPDFRKALELYPDQPSVLNYLGYSWIDMGMNLDEGLKLIQKAVDQRPDDGFIVDSLGWAYFKLGKMDDAVREMERAVSLKPEDPILNDHLGDVYWYAGRRREAVFQWNHARDLKPEPDVLLTIEKKLKEGLPDQPVKKAADGSGGDKAAIDMSSTTKTTVAAPAGSQKYTVVKGDNLWDLARKFYGDATLWTKLHDANAGAAIDNLEVGSEIDVPSR